MQLQKPSALTPICMEGLTEGDSFDLFVGNPFPLTLAASVFTNGAYLNKAAIRLGIPILKRDSSWLIAR